MKKNRTNQTIFSFLMIACLLFSFFNTNFTNNHVASAKETTYDGTVTAYLLNIRASADTYSTVLGKLANGTNVTILSEHNGWGKIQFKNTNGYISLDYVEKVKTSSTSPSDSKSDTVTYMTPTVSALVVRESPSTYSNRLTLLTNNDVIKVEGYSADKKWAYYVVNNKNYYVYLYYLKNATEESYNKQLQPVVKNPTSFKGQSNANNLNVRTRANTYASVLGQLQKGDVYTFTEFDEKWLTFTYQNKTAFVYKSYIDKYVAPPVVNDKELSKKGKTTAALNIRETANFSAKPLGVIPKDVNISYNVHDSTWHYVEYEGKKGYIYNIYVAGTSGSVVTPPKVEEPSTKPTPAPSETPVNKKAKTTTYLNVRESSNPTSKILGVLTKDEEITIISSVNNWGKINYKGQTGYISLTYITYTTEKPPETVEPPKVEPPAKNEFVYTVTASNLNVRSESNALSPIIGTKYKDQQLTVYEELSNGWLKIDSDGKIGYVSGYYVKKSKDSIASDVTQNVLKGKHIVLDAGHGGFDGGASGNGIIEKNHVLDLTLNLQRKLEASGAKVTLTRSTDVYIGLSQRAAVATTANADVFVSIHANASDNLAASGLETFYYKSGDAREKSSLKLATSIQQEMVSSLGFRNRGVRDNSFTVLFANKKPSVLVEVGFLSNEYEASLMKKDATKETTVSAIYKGLQKYFQ